MSNNSVLAKWEEMKKIVESLEHDVSKNANGNASAGVRARKGLRQLAACSKELVKSNGASATFALSAKAWTDICSGKNFSFTLDIFLSKFLNIHNKHLLNKETANYNNYVQNLIDSGKYF